MSAKKIDANAVGLPQFAVEPNATAQAFDLSSHTRAREALQLGLAAEGSSHNIYVIGPDRAGRMTATRNYVSQWAAGQPPGEDWVYLYNFANPAKPLPLALPAGTGRALQKAMAEAVPALASELAAAFNSEGYQHKVTQMRSAGEAPLSERMRELEAQAQDAGLSIVHTPQGSVVAALDDEGKPKPVQALADAQREQLENHSQQLMEQLAELNRRGARLQAQFFESLGNFSKEVAARATAGVLDRLQHAFASAPPALADWVTALKGDLIENFGLLLQRQESGAMQAAPDAGAQRYSVNLLVDRTGESHRPLVVEQNPTYENLFGRIEYRQAPTGALTTDVSLIRGGALHRANGGVLVLRDAALAQQPMLWGYLKAALRDNEIRIEEFYRAGSPPIAGAPIPSGVPLNLKIVLVGSPQWYYSFFARDVEFSNYFKLQAHIDSFVEATPANLACYAKLIIDDAASHGVRVDPGALQKLLGMAARWASHRERLTAQFEIVTDLLLEAAQIAGKVDDNKKAGAQDVAPVPLAAAEIAAAIKSRRRRNALIEDSVHRAIEDGTTMIDVTGSVVGQINGLTVRTVGEHAFGTPSRITARASVGRRGVVNIERDVAMSGPIQQKGILVLQGILMRRFARTFPLSFDCSITFEQLYGGVDGDSASMAEFIGIISDLAEVPLRQDLAITGSINQLGEAQVIGGAHHKIEGFFRACEALGPLTGSQGVVIPAANEAHLVLRDDVAAAIEDGHFHVTSVTSVESALELFTGMPAGDAEVGDPSTVYGRVRQTLEQFDAALTARGV